MEVTISALLKGQTELQAAMATFCQRVTPAAEFSPSTKVVLARLTPDDDAEIKLKEILGGLSNLALSEAEVLSVMALLCDKSPRALDAWCKSAAKADPETQERERLFITLREETSFALDKVKQLSQELQVEKQKTGRAESILRELADSLKKLARERDDLAGEVLGLRQQLEDKDLKELVKKHKSAVSQAAQNLSQISDLQAQLEEALKEKQEVQEKVQALQSQLEFKEQSTVERSQVGRQKAKVRELETKLEFEKAQVKRLKGLVASQETQRNVELTAERNTSQCLEGARALMERQNKSLQAQLEREASRCRQLGAANAELAERLASVQGLGRRKQRLERSHQRLLCLIENPEKVFS